MSEKEEKKLALGFAVGQASLKLEEIRELFPEGMLLTLVLRDPREPANECCLTDDDIGEVRETLKRADPDQNLLAQKPERWALN